MEFHTYGYSYMGNCKLFDQGIHFGWERGKEKKGQ